jgi:hypothetical protein
MGALDSAWQEWQRSKLLARWREANPGEATKPVSARLQVEV